jgi:hypothetical protein
MDQRLVTAVQTVDSMNKQEAASALVSALKVAGARRHAVRAARDRFNAIVAQARNGTPQLIGARPKNMTVVISLADLVDFVRVAAKGQSFGEALDAEGFRPVSCKKMAVRPGFPQEPLVRRRSSKRSGGE